MEQSEASLVAVLNDVLFDFAYDASHVSTVNLCVESGLLVSARTKPLRSIDRLRESVRPGETFRSTAELLAHLLRDQADVLVAIVRETTARVDAVEDQVLAPRGSSRSELGSQRRSLVRLQRLLAPEPAALFRLLSRPPRWIPDADQQDLREAAEELTSAVADSAELNERVKLLQEELAALVNEQTNQTLYVLTLVTVLALPINVVAGLMGMNVGGRSFLRAPGGLLDRRGPGDHLHRDRGPVGPRQTPPVGPTRPRGGRPGGEPGRPPGRDGELGLDRPPDGGLHRLEEHVGVVHHAGERDARGRRPRAECRSPCAPRSCPAIWPVTQEVAGHVAVHGPASGRC